MARHLIDCLICALTGQLVKGSQRNCYRAMPVNDVFCRCGAR